MALYRLEAKIISRGKGQSVVAAAAYRSGEALYSERDQEMKYAKSTSEVLLHEMHTPEGTPKEIAGSLHNFVNAIEAHEVRRDAMLARELLVSLPRELSFDQNAELVRGFAQELTEAGMAVHAAYHQGTARDGLDNMHCHLLCSIRGCGSGRVACA